MQTSKASFSVPAKTAQRTYFVAQGILAPNENGDGEKATAGKDNLYEVHYEGLQWTTTFIAVLSNEDAPQWEGFGNTNRAFLTARVSPNGRYLAFMSGASPRDITTSMRTAASPTRRSISTTAQTASLRCVSCDPTNARPVGVFDTEDVGEGLGLLVDRRKVWFGHWLAGNIPGWTAENITSAIFQSRYLSDKGRLFFNSPDDLVPQASNRKEDVYEYEPSGLGSCESSSGGCVSLISSGNSSKESAFLEANPDGSDVFFLTAAQLLPQDTDTAYDIYDARVCTLASPCLTPPAPVAARCGTTEACRAAGAQAQAQLGPSGTATSLGRATLHRTQSRKPSRTSKASKSARNRRGSTEAHGGAESVQETARPFQEATLRLRSAGPQALLAQEESERASQGKQVLDGTHKWKEPEMIVILGVVRRARAQEIASRLALALLVSALVLAAVGAVPSFAESPSWHIGSETAPTNLAAGGEGLLFIDVSDFGDAAIRGGETPVIITDKLPSGLRAISANTILVHGVPVECSIATGVRCTYAGVLNPYEEIEVPIGVKVEEPPGTVATLIDEASVEGGGAAATSKSLPVRISGEAARFGVESYELDLLNEDGTPATQAG